MPERPRSDRLLRDELVMLQRDARRRWLEDDDFADRDPAAWQEIASQNDDMVRVSIHYADPGSIVMGNRGTVDLPWDAFDALPFEDRTIDCVYLYGKDVSDRLAKHLARVVRVGGEVVLDGPGGDLTDHGFDQEERDNKGRRVMRLVEGKTSLEQAAPLFVDEHVMGERVIRRPRQPSRY